MTKKNTIAPSEGKCLIEIAQKPWPINRPLVSIIISCFNDGHYINAALDSIFSQSFQDFEIIVIDGGSTDGITTNIINKINRIKTRKFIRHHRRFAGDNRNFGIKRARGKYVCCLDPDDRLTPIFLERALFLLECAGYDIVSANYRFWGDQNYEVFLPDHPSFAQLIGGAAVANTAVLPKKFWANIGGYCDTGINSQYIPEDWDFYVRAAGRGARIYNLQESLLTVGWHMDSLGPEPQNPSYAIQVQVLRERHKKILQHKNFENFVSRSETVFSVTSSTRNLIRRTAASQSPGTLIIAPSSLNTLELDRHLKQISNIDLNGNIVVLTFGSINNLPENLRDRYTGITSNIFSMIDTSDNPVLKITLLDYLIESRQIKKFIVGSLAFEQENTARLLDLYDQISSSAPPTAGLAKYGLFAKVANSS